MATIPMVSGLSAEPLQSLFAQAPEIPSQIAPRGGMFGGNGQMAMMAAISALMARRHPQVSQMMQGLLQNKLAQQDFERRRQQQMQDEVQLFDYKQAHAGPDDFTQRVQALNAMKPGLGDTYAQNYANNGGGSVIQFTDPATGQRYMMQGGNAQMPQIGAIVDDPRKQGGAGAAVPPPIFPR